jgi:hypothetical protein
MLLKIFYGYILLFCEGTLLSLLLLKNSLGESLNWGFLFPGYPVTGIFQLIFNDTGDPKIYWFVPAAMGIYAISVLIIIKFLR